MAPPISVQVRKAVPSIDPIVSEYAAGYASYVESLTHDAVASVGLNISQEISFLQYLLISAGGNSDAVSKLSENLRSHFTKLLEENASKMALVGDTSRRVIDRTLLANQSQRQSSSMALLGATTDIEHTGRKMETRVDKKKLEKAERKIRAKLEKREENAVRQAINYEASRILEEQEQEDYDSFYLKVNPLDVGGSYCKSKDIKVENFDLYVGAGKRILSDTTLTLSYGHRYGLVGQNGIGKSTLLRALARRELNIPKHITILHVEQELTGDDTTALQSVLDADVWRKQLLIEESKINERVSEIEKLRKEFDEESHEVRQLDAERDELEEHLLDVDSKLAEIESDKAEGRAASILSGLGFSKESQGMPTNSFSGGWRMRLSLARALFCKPDLLLLDEPSNMLDVPSITYLADYLRGYPSTVLVVSHDRAFLNEVATDIIHQHSERLDYYRGSNFDNFYATREERQKNAVREYENQMAYRKHLQTFIDKFRYNAAKSSEAQSRIKKLEKLPILEPPEEVKSIVFRFPEAEKLSPPIIQLQDVSFGYTPEKLILKGCDLDVQMDSRIALVGANGAGKTTLLKLLLGQLQPVDGIMSRNPRLRIGYFAQHHVDQMDLNLSAVSWMAKTFHSKSDEEYRRHLGAFGITGTLGLQKMALLSGGQKSRVAFAALGLANPHILILDEPTNHLDTQGLDSLADAFKQFNGGILMVSHDVTMIDRVCNQLWVCEDGQVVKFPGTIYDYKVHILASADASGVVKQH